MLEAAVPLDDCARQAGRRRAPDAVRGNLGNHRVAHVAGADQIARAVGRGRALRAVRPCRAAAMPRVHVARRRRRPRPVRDRQPLPNLSSPDKRRANRVHRRSGRRPGDDRARESWSPTSPRARSAPPAPPSCTRSRPSRPDSSSCWSRTGSASSSSPPSYTDATRRHSSSASATTSRSRPTATAQPEPSR